MAEKIKLTFLGTGSAVPTERRNQPALLLQFKNENILFDCGEGTQRQFRKAKLNPCKITKIFLTHWHGDHILGLPGLLQTLALNEYNGKLQIYGPKNSRRKFQELILPHLKFYLDLARKEGNNFEIEILEAKDTVIENEEFKIESKETFHGTPSLAYSFIIKEKNRLDKERLKKLNIPNGPLLGELAKGKTIEIEGKKIDGKKLIYKEPQRKITLIMDTTYKKELENFSKDSDTLICESTYSAEETEIAEEHFHMTSKQAATIAKNSKSKKLFLTHLSQRYETKPGQKQILEGAKKVFKETEIAKDLDKVEL